MIFNVSLLVELRYHVRQRSELKILKKDMNLKQDVSVLWK